jgi:hypothetical protein
MPKLYQIIIKNTNGYRYKIELYASSKEEAIADAKTLLADNEKLASVTRLNSDITEKPTKRILGDKWFRTSKSMSSNYHKRSIKFRK